MHPVTLGMALPRHERGTPLAAARADAERIVNELAAMSRPYGTTVRWDGQTGTGSVPMG